MPRRRTRLSLATAASLTLLATALGTQAGAASPTAAPPTLKGHVYAGYQGWFNHPSDGSPLGAWRHWAGSQPSPGNQTFELWPDTRAYPDSVLAGTGYAPLGNGDRARLFSSYPSAVVEQHFDWMRDNGLDGAALQRFGSDVSDPASPRAAVRNSVADKARKAAERTGRGFYVEYDVSGLTDANFEQVLQDDWTNVVTGSLHLTDSPAYVHQDGKPVVELWGLGFSNRPGSAEQSERIVNWFRSKGLYVVGGVPTGWRTDTNAKPGFGPVYQALDMLSPWMVGNAGDNAPQIAADLAALTPRGQDYLPVIYPGFSWSNWKDGPRNEIPRRSGDFLWQQAVNVRKAGVGQAFLAMFDEYDEATAIAPAAEDSSMIPTDQYFQTTSADGTYLSADFYLRLAGAATGMISGRDPLDPKIPIPPSTGPVQFRTGFEPGTDARPTTGLAVTTSGGKAHRGNTSLTVKGAQGEPDGTAAAPTSYGVFDVDIPVTRKTELTYYLSPADAAGRAVTVDLLLDNGRTVRTRPAGKVPLSAWTKVTSRLNGSARGHRITKILVTAPGTGTASVDDLTVTNR
ncbi:glycoside hydrolase family 71/99-like protein [Streptomyces sp. AM 3-1-1]|uniref:glycoside hydrolase family 71/99-like protein n=1 Tax=Streptomyces sp. AM 3-1-1 TaxID=3028711 RepID=UPI0023B9E85B|nr:glycoside hydrolase family 71/99-like protein [Streptomyces sp. AM 3-1-1]WEH29361.1 glycoside hydrolase family 71/99-like protein [Streptomyces sp. AM 3-1-1]